MVNIPIGYFHSCATAHAPRLVTNGKTDVSAIK